jgi:hypothetical protein
MWPIDPVSEETIASVWYPIDFVEETIGGDPPQLGEPNRYFRWDDSGNAFQILNEEQSNNLDIFRNITPGEAGAGLLTLSTVADVRNLINAPCLADENVFTGLNRFQHDQGVLGHTEIRKDRLALDYYYTRAALVIQHRDEQDGGYNDLIPGMLSSFYNDGDGWVDGDNERSMTIWMGNSTYVTKRGNGSAHAYTASGQLLDCSDYNEGGAFQAMFTNNGSNLGYISLFEGLAQDTPDNGANHYSTSMIGAATRINKHNPTGRISANFMASSEGSQPVDAALLINPNGAQLFKRVIDTTKANVTTGQAFLIGNNTNIAWQNQAKTENTPILWVNNSDDTYLSSAHDLHFVSDTLDDKLVIDTGHATDSVCIFVGGALRRVILGAATSGGAHLLLAH